MAGRFGCSVSVVLFLALAGSAVVSSAADASCAYPRHAHVVTRTASAWIAWRPAKPLPDQDQLRIWSACLKGRRPVVLTTTSSDAYSTDEVSFPRLAGRYAGFVTTNFNHSGSGISFIHRVDLARRRALFEFVGSDAGVFGDVGAVLDMRMNAQGETAWLRDDDRLGIRLFVLDTAGERPLDQDPDPQLSALQDPQLSALRVHGRAISWRHGAQRRTAMFAQQPSWCPVSPASRVLARSHTAWVAVAPRRRVLGCRRGHSPMLLTRADDGEFFSAGRHVRGALLRGDLVGVWVEDDINTFGTKTDLLLRADLARQTFFSTVEAFRRGDSGYDQGLRTFDMNSAGDLAWIAYEDGNQNHVVVLDGLGRRVIDSVLPPSVLSDLRVDGNSIFWTLDGTPRSATFNR